jgi:hypothetical protein
MSFLLVSEYGVSGEISIVIGFSGKVKKEFLYLPSLLFGQALPADRENCRIS